MLLGSLRHSHSEGAGIRPHKDVHTVFCEQPQRVLPRQSDPALVVVVEQPQRTPHRRTNFDSAVVIDVGFPKPNPIERLFPLPGILAGEGYG